MKSRERRMEKNIPKTGEKSVRKKKENLENRKLKEKGRNSL